MRNYFIIFVLIFIGNIVFSQSYMEKVQTMKMIKSNKKKLDFLKVAVSNYGNEKAKKALKEAYTLDYDANTFYMQVKYKVAYEAINNSLRKQIEVYRMLLDIYIDDVDNMLKKAVKDVVDSDNKVAGELLREAYGQLISSRRNKKTLSKLSIKSGDARAIHPTRYSKVIIRYQKTLNFLRTAKRKLFESIKERGYIILPQYDKDQEDIALRVFKGNNTTGNTKSGSGADKKNKIK